MKSRIEWVGMDAWNEKVTVMYENGTKRKYNPASLPKTVSGWMEKNEPKMWKEIEMKNHPFGLVACMDSVEFSIESLGKNPFEMLKEYEERAKKDICFNKVMIEAVQKYIEDHSLTEAETETKEVKVGHKYISLEDDGTALVLDDGIQYKIGVADLTAEERSALGIEAETATPETEETKGKPHIYIGCKTLGELLDEKDEGASVGVFDGDKLVAWENEIQDIPATLHELQIAYTVPSGKGLSVHLVEGQTKFRDITDRIGELKRHSCHIEYICDYDGDVYLTDAVSEIADNQTSIYNWDISTFLDGHIDEVEKVIDEFGWVGVGRSLMNAAQMAEYETIEAEMYENELEMCLIYAYDHYRRRCGDIIAEETADEIADDVKMLAVSRLHEITDAVDAIIGA